MAQPTSASLGDSTSAQRMANTDVPATTAVQNVEPQRPRMSKRTTSYNSHFQTQCVPSTDTPPSYANAIRSKAPQLRRVDHDKERLPTYSCTVEMEAKLLLNLESISPLHGTCQGEWREVYAIARGTMISFHKVKDGRAGKLLRSYTLQHAEVGLATDTEHAIYVPMTRLAHFVPASARRRAWKKDPDSFQAVGQTILRLRAETDQVLLADSSEEKIHDVINTIAAAIDISHALDERSIPKQCTVPRRRRRQRPTQVADVMNDPALLAEQVRLFQQLYPSFAGARPVLPLPEVQSANSAPAREEDEVDLSMMRESAGPATTNSGHASTRPENVRQTTSTTIGSTFSEDMMYATLDTNFDSDGKWSPPNQRSSGQVLRYIRRCMPILLADSPRASDVLIAGGRRMRINWRMEMLEEWQLSPPNYKSHNFAAVNGQELSRSLSHRSAPESASTQSRAEQQSADSIMVCDSEHNMSVEPIDGLRLTKVVSNVTNHDNKPGSLTADMQVTQSNGIHGVVFCF